METVNDISLEGFKVVSSDFFYAPTKLQLPTFTVWDGSISFSKHAVLMMNYCENVLLQIHSEGKKALVTPSSSKDKDAVRWLMKKEPFVGRKINCPKLTDKLYEVWNWDKNYTYRAVGKLVTSGNKVMLLFDFSQAESWKRPEAKNVQ